MGVVISYATNLPGTDVMAWRSGCLILLVCVYVLWFFVFYLMPRSCQGLQLNISL